MSFQAVIFDMDGVLVDTEHFYYKRRETYLASQGISIDHLPPAYFIPNYSYLKQLRVNS